MNRVPQQWLFSHGHQGFGNSIGEWTQTSAESSGKDQSTHKRRKIIGVKLGDLKCYRTNMGVPQHAHIYI